MLGYDGKVVLAKYKTATYNASITDGLRKSGAGKLIARYSRMQRSKAMRKIYK